MQNRLRIFCVLLFYFFLLVFFFLFYLIFVVVFKREKMKAWSWGGLRGVVGGERIWAKYMYLSSGLSPVIEHYSWNDRGKEGFISLTILHYSPSSHKVSVGRARTGGLGECRYPTYAACFLTWPPVPGLHGPQWAQPFHVSHYSRTCTTSLHTDQYSRASSHLRFPLLACTKMT